MKTFSRITFVVLFLTAGMSFGCFSLSDGGGSQYRVVETIPSPSKTHTAYYWNWMGGGAAGWCFQKVSIFRSTEEPPFSTQPEKGRIPYVFSTRCSSDVKISWIDDNRLRISHSLGDDPFPTSLSQASRTDDGSVKIVYEFIEK